MNIPNLYLIIVLVIEISRKPIKTLSKCQRKAY